MQIAEQYSHVQKTAAFAGISKKGCITSAHEEFEVGSQLRLCNAHIGQSQSGQTQPPNPFSAKLQVVTTCDL